MHLQDKLTCLGGHLWLHSAVAALADGLGGRFRRLAGGLPPAIPMWSLRLAAAFHESCLGQACLHLTSMHAGSGGPPSDPYSGTVIHLRNGNSILRASLRPIFWHYYTCV